MAYCVACDSLGWYHSALFKAFFQFFALDFWWDENLDRQLCVYRKNVALLLENVKSAMGIRMSEFHITCRSCCCIYVTVGPRKYCLKFPENFRFFFHAAATSSENVLGISDSPDIDLQLRKMKESQNAVPWICWLLSALQKDSSVELINNSILLVWKCYEREYLMKSQ